MAAIRIQPQFIALGTFTLAGKEVPVLITKEWRRPLEQLATAVNLLQTTNSAGGASTFSFTGDVTGGTSTGYALTLADTTVTPGSYTNADITVGSDGRVTAAANGSGGGGSGTVTSVDITQPAAGITASGGPVTTSGSITLALADDLAAVEALSATGIVRRTGTSVWSAGTAVDLTSEVTGVLPVANYATGTPTGSKFVRDDGVLAVPAGSGGTVTTVSVVTANGVSGSVATATTTPAITLTLGAITPTSVAASSTVTGSNLSGTNTGDQTITLTGDVTGSGTGSFAATLATVNSNVGSFGSATKASVFTVNGKGLVTAASETTVTPAVGSITGLGTGVATALAVNVGTAGAPVVNGGALGTPSSGTLTNCTGLPASAVLNQQTIVAMFYPGVPTASALCCLFSAPAGGITTLTFAAAIAGSAGKALTAATAQTDFDVRKNATTSASGSSVGTIRFAAGGTVPTFIAASGFTLTGGSDTLSVWAPATPDTTLADISASLYCTRS